MLTVLEADRWVSILSRIAMNVFGDGGEMLIKQFIEQLPNLISNPVNWLQQEMEPPDDIKRIFAKYEGDTSREAFWKEILDLQVGSPIVNENPRQIKNLIREKIRVERPTEHGSASTTIYEFVNEDFPENPEFRQWEGLLLALAPIWREVELVAWQQEQQVMQTQQQVIINDQNHRLSRASTPTPNPTIAVTEHGPNFEPNPNPFLYITPNPAHPGFNVPLMN